MGLFYECFKLYAEMAPYLLLGFATAGVLHILLPEDKIGKHLRGRKFSALLKATAFGVPLPLCSCGVIPVAAHLEKKGASRGPILSFLAATPTTGVDSMMATYSLLGWLFTLLRIAAAFVAGIMAGALSNIFDPGVDEVDAPFDEPVEASEPVHSVESVGFVGNVKEAVRYGFGELIYSVSGWILFGVFVGGVITYALPEAWVDRFLGSPTSAYLFMLVISAPMYVCATGSIPIAASLILKGVSPGAGLVFLVAGPATNTATMSFVGGKLGGRALAIYVFSILVTAFGFGIMLDLIWNATGRDLTMLSGGMNMLPWNVNVASAVLLILLMMYSYWTRRSPSQLPIDEGVHAENFQVEGMTCSGCRDRITQALMKVSGVVGVNVNLEAKSVVVLGNAERDLLIHEIKEAGYDV